MNWVRNVTKVIGLGGLTFLLLGELSVDVRAELSEGYDCEAGRTPIPPFYITSVKSGWRYEQVTPFGDGPGWRRVTSGSADVMMSETMSSFKEPKEWSDTGADTGSDLRVDDSGQAVEGGEVVHPAKRISRGSLVRPVTLGNDEFLDRLYWTERMREARETGTSVLVPVEVISRHEAYRNLKPECENVYGHATCLQQAEVGDFGEMDALALEPAGDQFVFMLQEDTYLLQGEHERLARAGVGLIPKRVEWDDRGTQLEPPEYEINCFNGRVEYLYELVGPKGKELGDEPVVLGSECVPPMQPLLQEHFDDFQSLRDALVDVYDIDDIPLVSDFGRSQFPMIPVSSIPLSGERDKYQKVPGVFSGVSFDRSTIHYEWEQMQALKNPPQPNMPVNYGVDLWAESDALCTFIRSASDWKTKCMEMGHSQEKCMIQVGDIGPSTPNEGAFTYKHHGNGRCFDVALFRKDDAIEGVHYGNWSYDRGLTGAFAEHFIENGATVGTTDTSLCWKLNGGCLPGHQTHMHVCFKEKDALELDPNAYSENLLACGMY